MHYFVHITPSFLLLLVLSLSEMFARHMTTVTSKSETWLDVLYSFSSLDAASGCQVFHL